MSDDEILYVCWQDPEGRGIYPVARLRRLKDRLALYEFRYLKGAIEARGFEPFLSFPDFSRRYTSSALFPFFGNLLMSEKRADYAEYVGRLGLDPGAPRDAFAIISRDLGGGASEDLEVFGMPERDGSTGVLTYHFPARGVRHVAGAEEAIRDLREGEQLEVEPEPQNPQDPHAVKLLKVGDRRPLGYVPFYLSEDLASFLAQGVHPVVVAEKVNLPPAPIHHRLLCKMTVKPAKGFKPFATERFEPIESADLGSALPHAAAGKPSTP